MSVVADQERRAVTTGEAARALGYSRRALAKWAADGRITPAYRSPGGHLRWYIEDLREQLRALPPEPDDDPFAGM